MIGKSNLRQGFDGLGLNEHHQNGYGFPVSPNLIATNLARRKSDAAIVMLGNTLPLYNPPIRVAEEMAARITGAQVQLIEGAGHVPQLEQREVVSHRVLQFLASGSRKTRQGNGV
jgi:pimeloyl-ACP methyl ester carboxylesterase